MIPKSGYRFSEKIMLQQQVRSAVGQEVFADVVAVRLEQDARAAVLEDLFVGPLDHAVTLARVGGEHLAAGGDLEALLGARLRLHLGHLGHLLDRSSRTTRRARLCGRARLVRLSEKRRHGSPLAGRRKARLYGR